LTERRKEREYLEESPRKKGEKKKRKVATKAEEST